MISQNLIIMTGSGVMRLPVVVSLAAHKGKMVVLRPEMVVKRYLNCHSCCGIL